MGQAVHTDKLADALVMNLEHLPAGQYFIELSAKGQDKPAIKMISIY